MEAQGHFELDSPSSICDVISVPGPKCFTLIWLCVSLPPTYKERDQHTLAIGLTINCEFCDLGQIAIFNTRGRTHFNQVVHIALALHTALQQVQTC